uniref:Uncharacterized protein n=1 Tax=Cairina moschata TaxID=8855 RepID=A0A8C3GLU8_CAIMO
AERDGDVQPGEEKAPGLVAAARALPEGPLGSGDNVATRIPGWPETQGYYGNGSACPHDGGQSRDRHPVSQRLLWPEAPTGFSGMFQKCLSWKSILPLRLFSFRGTSLPSLLCSQADIACYGC